MALFSAPKFVLLTAIFYAAIRESEPRNFPVDGCSTDEMDVLMLYSETEFKYKDLFKYQQKIWKELAQHLLSFQSNESTPRIMFAEVFDRFSASDPLVDVSAWKFMAFLQEEPYGFVEQQPKDRKNLNVQEIVEKKVAFTRRLFSEMGEVRENVTQVAVLFLHGTPLSQEQSRSVPRLIEQEDTDIKIFTVVLGSVDKHNELIYLHDTLIGTIFHFPAVGLVMAMCDQCVEESFRLRHTASADYLSCYKILQFSVQQNHDQVENKCKYGSSDTPVSYGTLVAMESYEELDFLRAIIASYLNELGNDAVANNVSTVIPIGLRREATGLARRFKWFSDGVYKFRPLVVNKWLPGQPSGGYKTKCAVWKFSWDRGANVDAVDVSGSNEELVDGWLDVGCEDEVTSFGLCETTLTRRVDELPLIKIKPANEESFRRIFNLHSYEKFGDNLVSIIANMDNSEFRQQLRETNQEFPVFDCNDDVYNSQHIPYLHVCDNITHCSNRRDEYNCYVNPIESQGREDVCDKNCYGVKCCQGPCLPLQLVNDGEVDCWICDIETDRYSDERPGLNKFVKKNETCAFICNNDQCVHFSQLNDGHTDCTGPEGPLDETVGKLKTADTCYNMLGHKIWAPMCVYVKDRFDNLLGCRDLSHLKNCTDFECPEGYVKCLNTYCTPQHYVLDKKVDCPTGEDEQADIIGPCTGNFACWNSKICLHPDLVCDGHPDCPHGDDEAECIVKVCDEGFRCVAGTVTVSDYDRSIPLTQNPSTSPFIYVDLSGLDLSEMERSLVAVYVVRKTIFYKYFGCKLRDFDWFLRDDTETVQKVDVSFNQIQKLDGKEFYRFSLQNLRVLNMSHNRELLLVRSLSFTLLETFDLSHTALASIDESDIGGLRNLKHLDLSFTRITRLDENALQSNAILQTLDLRGLLLEDVHQDLFNGLTVSLDLYTDSYQLCCPQVRGANIPEKTCHAPDDAISSCFDLIGVDVQRVLLWVVAVLAVLGNITVIVYRVIWDRSVLRTGYGLFVTNLGISDFIMGIYLFIIAGADYYYRGVYVLHDESWRESVACTLAGFLATLSSETSILFIFLISVDIFLVIRFSFGQLKFTQNCKRITVILFWVFGFLLALTPIVFRFDLYSSNAVCLGLPLTTKRINGWEFSFSVFIALNMSLCLVIAYVQRAIFQAMSENRIAGTESNMSPRRIIDTLVAKQLSLVALSCFFCWFPIGVMGLLSLSGHEIGNDVFAWTTVIVMSVHSAANPILYTIPAAMAKWEKFKQSGKRSR